MVGWTVVLQVIAYLLLIVGTLAAGVILLLDLLAGGPIYPGPR